MTIGTLPLTLLAMGTVVQDHLLVGMLLGMVVSGLAAGLLTRRHHGPGRAWSVGIAAAMLLPVVTLTVLIALYATADSGHFS